MKTITDTTGTRYPIIMGALGALATPALVAAVSEAGGYGLLATISYNAESLEAAIADVRKLTDKPFGANLVVLNPNAPEMIGILARAGVQLVTTSAGSPKALTPAIHEAGMKVLHVVPSAALAAKAEAAGVDGVVAEGGESGGMQSPTAVSTLCLVPGVLDAVSIPVVAAGGIYDGRTYAAALALGAQGVQLGTRLMLTEESGAATGYKNALLEAGLEDSLVVPMQVGPLRVLRNQFIVALEGAEGDERLQRVTTAWAQFNQTSIQEGAENGLVMTGQCAGSIKEILPAGEVIQRMAEEGEAILRSLAS